MALLRFSKLPKHQRYEYKPRYWNPEKEELEERLKQIEQLKGGNAEGMKARIQSGLRRGSVSRGSHRRQAQVRRSNFVLFAVVLGLLAMCYVFLTQYLPQIVETLESSGSQIN